MGLESDISFIGQVALFRDLSRDQMRLLAFGSERLRLAADAELFAEDGRADSAFIVIEGEIQLYRERAGERMVVGKVGPGQLLGELALIAPGRRATAACASRDTELLRIDQKLFRRLLEEYPETALVLHNAIAANLKSLLDRITALGHSFRD